MRTVLTLLSLLFTVCSFAQKEGANWYFGENAGLDFNSGQPLPLLDGQVNSVEGSATISDPNGNLLFYTDGTTIWNNLHEAMPNGMEIKGSSSSSQSAIIIPNPVNQNIYYVFTTDDVLLGDTGEFNGFNYTVVDMSLDDGRGDVIAKNLELLPVGSEKVSGILNFNGNYYWVITHFEDRFYSYRIDENGVDENPIISTLGPEVDDFKNGRGAIKLSPDGEKLALTYLIKEPKYDSNLFVFDFDANTGIVSNAVEALGHTRAYYGLEFSSNSKKLYASGVDYDRTNSLGNIQVVQFDLDNPDFFSKESMVLDFDNSSNIFVSGALQIGLDRRIYHSVQNAALSVIRNPNADSEFVNAEKFSLDLEGKSARFGLPTFVQSFFETIFEIENFCFNDVTTFTPEDTSTISNILWDFGDPSSGASNFSDSLIGEHIFSSTGTFEITIDVEYTNGVMREFIEYVEITEIPDVTAQVELVQCDIDGTDDGITSFNLLESIPLFNKGNDNLNVQFFESETYANMNVNAISALGYRNNAPNQIVFARVFSDSECFVLVEINLVAQPMSDLGFYNTIYICDGTLTENTRIANLTRVVENLSEDFINSKISLFTSAEDALFKLNQLELQEYSFNSMTTPELFFRIEENNTCEFIGKIELVIIASPEYEVSKTTYLCNGIAELIAPEGYDSYLWDMGSVQSQITVNQPGVYHVIFSTGSCSYNQTIEVLPEIEVNIEEVIIEDFNRINQVRIILGASELDNNNTFSIDGGQNFQNNHMFSNVAPGLYNLVVNNGCSIYEEEIVVGGAPAFFTPNNDGYNDVWTLSNASYFPNYKISIFDRYGKLIKSFADGQSGWDGSFLNRAMPADDYWYHLELVDGRDFKGFFTLKR